jgi:glyoxylase-like metal-dependent hydrolase (beta-lactamase superfamily II)/rhodanese-related sulfurtransferase
MLIKHIFIKKIAHSSYILAGQKNCAVIDPERDINIYIEEARSLGVKITHILQTHLHADFISGHLDLAKATGAKIYLAKSAKCKFDHIPLSEGDKLEIDNLTISVLETPGHTPEHLSYVVTDNLRGQDPIGVFVGDTLFVGDVGRPDLFPDIAIELAGKLYHSLHDKLLKLPDFCEVYPAHGAGSLCGRSMGQKYLTTIGYERKYNPVLQINNKETFIKSLTEDMPPAPDHFSRCSEINCKGPKLIEELPRLKELSVDEFKQIAENKENIIIDARTYFAYGSQHIQGSYHIDLNGNFPTFVGWIIPTDKDIYLIADDHSKAEECKLWANRVGIDRIKGYLLGGVAAWISAGFDTKKIDQISAREFSELSKTNQKVVLVDVRAPSEYQESHIEGAINIPVADLRTRYNELDKEKLTVLICSSGNRSSLGTSILESKGFTNLRNITGGFTGFTAAGGRVE